MPSGSKASFSPPTKSVPAEFSLLRAAVSRERAHLDACELHFTTATNIRPRRNGILGGLGPLAYRELEKWILQASSKHLGAILDIVSETVRAVAGRSTDRPKIGLAGSTATLQSRLYEKNATALGHDLEFVTPFDLKVSKIDGSTIQKRYVTDLIFGRSDSPDDLRGRIKAGAHDPPNVRSKMRETSGTLLGWFGETGVRTVILGCTELPLGFRCELLEWGGDI